MKQQTFITKLAHYCSFTGMVSTHIIWAYL